MNLEPAYALAYRLLGGLAEKLTEKLSGFVELIRKAYLGVGPSSYISLMLLTGLISSVVSTAAIFILGLFTEITLRLCISLALMAFFGSWGLTVSVFYGYPLAKVKKMRTEIERDLPFIASYMAVMASAGVNPYQIFKSLAKGDVIPSITPIAKTIVRDVELLGLDALSAILRAAQLSPSSRFRSFLDGMVGTIHTGSDLAAYLRGFMEEALRTQRVKLREMAETLSVFSEAFIGLFVAGPIFLTITLTLMAVLGGVGGGLLMNPVLLLSLMVYGFMPIAGLFMVVLAKLLTPGE